MKSADEWVFELDANKTGVAICTQSKIAQIQLDAWKQGMSDAADLSEKGRSYVAARYIREKRDNTKTV